MKIAFSEAHAVNSRIWPEHLAVVNLKSVMLNAVCGKIDDLNEKVMEKSRLSSPPARDESRSLGVCLLKRVSHHALTMRRQ